MQLAIDTSTEIASLAILQDDRIISEMTWHCGLNHSVEMYPRLQFLLSSAKLGIGSTDCVYVAIGPGSFNGLRVGVSAAKGLAFSLNARIIGISTLEISAYQHALCGLPICALQNAGREEVAAAIYQQRPRGWREIAPAHLTTPPDLAHLIKERTLFCGEFDTAVAVRLKKLLRTRAVLASPAARLRRAAYLAELGNKKRLAEAFDDPDTLQPLYLRRPPITERKRI